MDNDLLEAARLRATEGEHIVSEMERIVGALQRNGHDAAEAEQMLRASRALLDEMHDDVTSRERDSAGGQ